MTVLAQWLKFQAKSSTVPQKPVQHSLAQSGPAQWTTLMNTGHFRALSMTIPAKNGIGKYVVLAFSIGVYVILTFDKNFEI